MRAAGDRILWSGTAEGVTTFQIEFVRKLFGVL
jgi:hypothetical protein